MQLISDEEFKLLTDNIELRMRGDCKTFGFPWQDDTFMLASRIAINELLNFLTSKYAMFEKERYNNIGEDNKYKPIVDQEKGGNKNVLAEEETEIF